MTPDETSWLRDTHRTADIITEVWRLGIYLDGNLSDVDLMKNTSMVVCDSYMGRLLPGDKA